MTAYTVSLDVVVRDENALYAEASAECEALGIDPGCLKDDDGIITSECLKMVIDPGESPAGCKIIECYVS